MEGQYTLGFFINGFFHYRWGELKELQSWITVCKEESVPYTVYNEQMEIIEKGEY